MRIDALIQCEVAASPLGEPKWQWRNGNSPLMAERGAKRKWRRQTIMHWRTEQTSAERFEGIGGDGLEGNETIRVVRQKYSRRTAQLRASAYSDRPFWSDLPIDIESSSHASFHSESMFEYTWIVLVIVMYL